MNIRGFVDQISPAAADGWLFVAGRKPATVQAWLDGQVIGESVADRFRPDLEGAGFGDGRCGFSIQFVREIGPDYLPAVAVKPAECDLEVPRALLADTLAVLGMMRLRYPAAGQSRSVFGGMWTDRTDAPALLAGRVAAGITPAEQAGPMAQLLQDGLMILPSDPGPLDAFNGNLTPLITSVLTAPAVLAALRQVLEDNPLVIAADLVESGDNTFYQPSTLRDLPSPNECLECLVPLTAGVSVTVVRDSHRLPEFLQGSQSRWVAPLDAPTAAELSAAPLDDFELSVGTVAIVGPALLHLVRIEPGACLVRLVAVPRRQETANGLSGSQRRQRVHASGLVLQL